MPHNRAETTAHGIARIFLRQGYWLDDAHAVTGVTACVRISWIAYLLEHPVAAYAMTRRLCMNEPWWVKTAISGTAALVMRTDEESTDVCIGLVGAAIDRLLSTMQEEGTIDEYRCSAPCFQNQTD